MLDTAPKKTSEGKSYQTFKHLRTCALPSRIPLVIVAPVDLLMAFPEQSSFSGPTEEDIFFDDGCTAPRYLTSNSRAWSSCRRNGCTSLQLLLLLLMAVLIALLLLEIRCFFLFVPNESSLTTIMVRLVSNAWLLGFDTLETVTASAGVGNEAGDTFAVDVVAVDEDGLKDERTAAA